MTAPVTVSISIKDITGTALPRARVTFERTAADIDGAIIAPAATTVTCEADGTGSASLMPNATGSQGTQYRVTIVNEHGELQYSGLATIPASNCNLHAILTTPAPATVSDAQAAANAAQADAAQTALDVIATAADRVQTGLDRVATGEDADATAADRAAVDAALASSPSAAALTVNLAASTGATLVGHGSSTVAAVLDSHRRQAAAAAGIADNIIHGHSTNAVASDLSGATIGGGGQANYNNVIGGDGSATVNTATPNATSTGTNANYSAIPGGYDNVAGGLASIILGFHNYTGLTSTHGTIGGGSVQKITAGDYNTICGGTLNTVTGGSSYAAIHGGGGNTINVATGQDFAVIGGGFQNSVTARHGIVAGGSLNTVGGIAASVGGGVTNAASGNYSCIAGGEANTAGGVGSCVGGGYTVTLSATAGRSDYSGTVAGYQNSIGATAAARFSGMLSGRSNTIDAEYAAIIGGRQCSVTGEAGVASGYGAKSYIAGQQAHAGGFFSTPGDAQTSVIIARRQTSDATPTELRTKSDLGSRILIPVDTTWAFSILVVARRADADNESAAYKLEGCIDRNTAGSPILVGSVTKTVLAEDSAAWDANALADAANGALQIQVTGEAGKTINWVARVTLVEVTG